MRGWSHDQTGEIPAAVPGVPEVQGAGGDAGDRRLSGQGLGGGSSGAARVLRLRCSRRRCRADPLVACISTASPPSASRRYCCHGLRWGRRFRAASYVDTSDTRGPGRPLLPSMLSATVPALAGLLVEKGLTASLERTALAHL